MKKFVSGKFGIDSNLFDIDIMYKVKTIVVLNHYTLMDVAYIYTWKRDTPMRFYFRVKKTRGFSKKLAIKKLLLQKQKQEIEAATIQKKKEEDEEKMMMMKKNDVEQEQNTNTKCDSKADVVSLPEPKVKEMKSVEIVKPSKKVSQLEIDVYDYDASQHSNFEIIPSPKFKRNSSNFSDDLKMKLVNKSKYKHNGVKYFTSPLHGFASADDTSTPTTKKEPKSKKSSPSTKSAIKMKFDLSKQNSVTIINMSDPDRKEIVKPIKPEKKNKSNKLLTVPPLTIKKNTMTTTMSAHNHHTTAKSNGKPLVSENPDVIKLIPQKDFEERKEDVKSDFLESFALTPISSLNSTGSSPEKEKNKDKDSKKDGVNSSSGSSSNSNSNNNGSSKSNDTTFVKPMALLFGSAKRKNKDPIKELPSPTFKKPKLDFNKPTVDGTLRPIKPAKKVDISKLSLSRNKKEEHKTIKLGPIDEALKAIQPPKKGDFVKFVAPRPIKKEDEPMIRLAPLENILKPEITKFKKSPSPPLALYGGPPMKGHIAPPGSTTPHPNLPGNRTPNSKRYQNIRPKTPRNNPFANIPNDVNRILQGAGTEIKSISSKESGTKIYGPPSINSSQMGPPAPPPRQTQSKGQSNYLNYAILNASKSKGNEVPPGCRTPMYSPSSPIYSPNSPSYATNFNIPIRKYTPNTPAIKPSSNSPSTSPNSTNLLQNMLNRQTKQFDDLFPSAPKKSSPSPPPSQSTEQQKTENNKSNKRPFPGSTSPSSGSSAGGGEPPEKQIKVKSLLNSCNINIPSSLSITITNDDAESKSPNSAGSKHKSPVNNYIEILKLPDKVESVDKPKSSLPRPSTPVQKPLPIMNGKVSPTKLPEITVKVEKKSPSPDKKPFIKKSPDTKKSPQELSTMKKFRHILPRTTTPPKSQSFVQPQITTNQTDTPKVSPTLPPPPPPPTFIPPHHQVQQQLTQHQLHQQQLSATFQSNYINEMIARNLFFPGASNLNGIINFQQAYMNYAKKEQSKQQIQSPLQIQQAIFEHLKNLSSQDEALQYLRSLGTASVAQQSTLSPPTTTTSSDRKSSKSSPIVDSKKSTSSTTK